MSEDFKKLREKNIYLSNYMTCEITLLKKALFAFPILHNYNKKFYQNTTVFV